MSTLPIDVAGTDEQVDTIQIETPDYTDYELLSPGTYTSPAREVQAERRIDKNGKPFLMARLEFGELVDAEGNRTFLRKPIVRYIFSFTRKQKGHQVETSDVATYLKAAGVELGGNVDIETLKNALMETASYPVRVRVDWTNRTPKNDATGEFLPERAYTSDFRVGANGSATYIAKLSADDIARLPEKRQAKLAEVVVNGFVAAKHRVGEFYRV